MVGYIDDLDKYELISRVAASESRSYCVEDPHHPRIYGKKDLSIWAILDRQDAIFFCKWLWSYTKSPWGKIYVARRVSIGSGAYVKLDNGMKCRVPDKQKTLYLHREIMLRTGAIPPSPKHKIVDHINGNSLDCRRINLRWATYSMNNEKKPRS